MMQSANVRERTPLGHFDRMVLIGQYEGPVAYELSPLLATR